MNLFQNRTRSLHLAALGALLAACAPPAAPQSAAQVATAPVAIAISAPATTVDGPIIVKHLKGELTLDKPATRIVACSEEAIDIVIAVGLQPIGICSTRITGATSGATLNQPHYFTPAQLGTPVFVGTDEAPSVEEIIKLKPDLVIIGGWNEKAYEQLKGAVPTLALDFDSKGYWRDVLPEVAKAMGRVPQAEQFIADYDASIASLQAQLADTAKASPNVLLWYSFAADYDAVIGPTWPGSKIFDVLGFTVLSPEGLDLAGGSAQVSPELLPTVDADIIFVIRTRLADGTIPHYPVDDILATLKGPRVIYEPIDRTRASSAPVTDKQTMEEIAALLLGNGTPTVPVSATASITATEAITVTTSP